MSNTLIPAPTEYATRAEALAGTRRVLSELEALGFTAWLAPESADPHLGFAYYLRKDGSADYVELCYDGPHSWVGYYASFSHAVFEPDADSPSGQAFHWDHSEEYLLAEEYYRTEEELLHVAGYARLV